MCEGAEVLLSSKFKVSAKVLKMFKRAKSVNGVKSVKRARIEKIGGQNINFAHPTGYTRKCCWLLVARCWLTRNQYPATRNAHFVA